MAEMSDAQVAAEGDAQQRSDADDAHVPEEHQAPEEEMSDRLQLLENNLGLLVTGLREEFDRIVGEIKKLNAYEILKDKIGCSAGEPRGTYYNMLYCRNRNKSRTTAQQCEDLLRMDVPRTVNGTGHTGPSVFCAASQNAVLRRSLLRPT